MINSIINYFDKTVEKYPQNIAVEDSIKEITYRELKKESLSVGNGILERLSEARRPIVIYLPKTIEAVASFLACLYTNNVYVPIDEGIPLKRLEAVLENLGDPLIITDENGLSRLSGINKTGCLYSELSSYPDKEIDTSKTIDTDPAYIMYTSGSTGVPKGVLISHRGVIDYANWVVSEFKIDSNSILGLQSGFNFDNCVFDIYSCFFTGAKMVIISELLFMYPLKLIDLLKEKRISCIFWVPTVMKSVAVSGGLSPNCLPDLKTVVFAGEVMPNRQLNIWRKNLPDCLYSNLYGPTEITVDCIYYVVDREFLDDSSLPIGIQCPNKRILLIDENTKEVKEPGVRGEIYVLGSGVGIGYWNSPELTAKAFIQNPLNDKYPEIAYKTGDIAYYSEDGLIMYVGRNDSQFKLRGNRIELGDIETAAANLEGVTGACAIFDHENEMIYLFLESKNQFNLRLINVELAKVIPKYMLPKKVISMEEFPLNTNKKIDRVKLKSMITGG